MHAAGGETPSWSNRVALHHAVVADDIAYGRWRDGGLTILDVKDKSAPKSDRASQLVPAVRRRHAQRAAAARSRDLLVVADEAALNIDQDQMKRTWMFDIRAKEQPGVDRHVPDARRAGLRRQGRPVRAA